MAYLQGTDIADLVTTSLNELGRLKFTDLMSDYQRTIALKRLIKKNKMTFDSGPEVQFNLITDHNNSHRWTAMYAPDVTDNVNVMTTGKVGWRHCTWNWSMDGREPVMNSGASKIVDFIKTKRITAFGSAIIGFEKAFWRVPSASDTLTMFGLPYWIVKSNTAVTTNNGFNGTVPSGYTVVGNISPTTFPRWSNYATQYTAVSKDDLIRKMRRAMYYTDFTPLVEDIPTYDTGEDQALYSNYSVVSTMEEILESQNENLGPDLASMDGKAIFRRTPVTPVIELDLDTTNPVYGVQWGELHCQGLRDWWMKETQIPVHPLQHTVSITHTDCTLNTTCRNRRRQFVLATDTTMSY